MKNCHPCTLMSFLVFEGANISERPVVGGARFYGMTFVRSRGFVNVLCSSVA